MTTCSPMITYFSFTATTSPSTATATSTSLSVTTTCSSMATTYFFMATTYFFMATTCPFMATTCPIMATTFTLLTALFMGVILWKCFSSFLSLISTSFTDGGVLDLCGLSSWLSISGHSVSHLVHTLHSCTCCVLHLLFICSPAHCLNSICSLLQLFFTPNYYDISFTHRSDPITLDSPYMTHLLRSQSA